MERELKKRDRKIVTLQTQLEQKQQEIEKLSAVLGSMHAAKEALLSAADRLDPYRYEDDL